MARAPVCKQAHIGPAEAHCPHVPAKPRICRKTDVAGGFRMARTTSRHLRERYMHGIGRSAVAHRSDPSAVAPAQAGDPRKR